jgi:hypothetical protein
MINNDDRRRSFPGGRIGGATTIVLKSCRIRQGAGIRNASGGASGSGMT